MNIRLLVVTSDVQGAASLKRALEDTKRFNVVPFADPVAAIEYLKSERQTAAVIDMEIPGYSGVVLIDSLLTVQSDLVIFASTSNSDRATEAVNAGAWGLLSHPYTARDVLSQIEQSPLIDATPLSDTGRGPAVEPDTSQESKKPAQPVRDPNVPSVSEKLAAEEPPMPGVEDGGTVATLMAMSEEEISSVLDKMANESGALDLLDGYDGEPFSTDTAAHRILELANTDIDALEDSENFDALMEDHSSPEFVREPDFLMNTAFEEEEELQDTQPADAARMLQSSDDEWMSSEPNIPASPTEETPQLPADVIEEPVSPTSPTKEASKVPADTTQESEGLTLDKLADESDEDALEETEWAEPPGTVSEQITEDVTIVDADYDDPQIAQMAVNLTQMSLESTAEATVLSKGNMLVAYAGPLSDADIDALSDKIADGWKDIGESNSRVRYVTLPSNGLDYMVYSRRTHEDFILSMVFASKTPLSVIREQGKRIGDALRSVPELVLEDEPLLESDGVTAGGDQPSRGGMQLQGLVDAENVTLADHTFVWLLRDPDEALAYATTEAINAGLRVQLHEMGWRVDVLDVEEDYVYLLAGVPGEQPPYEVVRGLQDRASQIARQQEQGLQTDGLWAESYFILSPGRELNVQEIQQYINFYRM